MKHSAIPVTLSLCALVLLSSIPVIADDVPAGAFGGTVEVRVVNVEAVVVDKDGQRVSGLGPADFRLVVDGEERAIDYFSEISNGALTQVPDEASGVSPSPSLSSHQPGSEVATGYLVFIDDFFTVKIDRDRGLRELIASLANLRPSDTMAVVAYDGTSVSRLCSWTSNHGELRQVLEAAMERDTGGIVRRWEQKDAESDTELRLYLRQLREHIERSVAAATWSMQAVVRPEGRRVMMLLCGGWPRDPSALLPGNLESRVRRQQVRGGEDLLQPLVDTANVLGYTIYAADLPGLRATSLSSDADSAGFDQDAALGLQSADTETGFTDPTDSMQPSPHQREREEESTLRLLARETGGEAVIHGSIVPVLDDTGSFYWLGFSPPVAADDSQHSIRVEVRRPGLKVRARRSYVDYSPDTRTTMLVRDALLTGGAAGSLVLDVAVGEITRVKRRRMRIPIEITIPTNDITVVQTPEAFEIRLEFRAAALDAWGRPSEIPVIPVLFTSDHPPHPGSHVTYRTTVEVARGTREILVTLTDPRIDQVLAKRIDLEEVKSGD